MGNRNRNEDPDLGREESAEDALRRDRQEIKRMLNNSKAGRRLDDPRGLKDEDE